MNNITDRLQGMLEDLIASTDEPVTGAKLARYLAHMIHATSIVMLHLRTECEANIDSKIKALREEIGR